METRRIVYYPRNSIKRSYSHQSVLKRLRMGAGTEQLERHSPPYIPKVFATKNCMWCYADFAEFRIVCNQCRNCQYCGMVPANTAHCLLCGNKLPEELELEQHRHKQIPKTRFV